jgi:hypothetical protein
LAAQTSEWTAHRDALMAALRGQWKTLLSTPAPFLPVVVPAAVAAAAGATAAGAVAVAKSGAAKKVDKPNVQSHADFPTLAVPASTAAAAAAAASDAATPGAPGAAAASAASAAPAKATASWVPALWPVASQTDAMIACGIARGELPFLAPLDGVWEMAAALLAHATPAQLDAVRDEVGYRVWRGVWGRPLQRVCVSVCVAELYG